MNDPVMETSSSDTRSSSQRSLIVYTIIALGLALIIRFYIAAPYIVSGASMEPTFDNFHYLIIDRVSYDLGEPQRGDVVVFKLEQNTGRALIKRVIGLPGETVRVEGNTVTIVNNEHPEGFALDESYLDPQNFGGVSDTSVVLGADQFFVLGDNRRVSADSRLWGTLPREDIVGRVFMRLYPLNKIGIFPGIQRYEE
jgi:signal peptidase I